VWARATLTNVPKQNHNTHIHYAVPSSRELKIRPAGISKRIQYRREFSQDICCQEMCMRTGLVTLMFVQEISGGKNCRFSKKKPLTVYKRHQIVITELKIKAVGIDFSRRTSRWAREDPRRARTWKSMKNMQKLIQMQRNKKTQINQTLIFLDETGCILNEKMMPDVTIMVPEIEIDKKQIGHQ
jgi:hypothetical protein